MRHASVLLALCLARTAAAVGPTVTFTLPVENTTPSVFGSLPYPCDLYFDQGRPGDGDGTLLNAGASIGLGTDVIRTNTKSVEDALDLLDGFGTTSAVYFFFSGPIDTASLPASPVLAPALGDGVFCAEAATATPVPIALRFDVDTRIPNVLAVLPLPGHPLKAKTTYACVVRRSVTGGGSPVEPSADWLSVRDGVSANGDADAIFDPVVATLGGAGVPASQIAGMTVFTTQSTTADLIRIRDVVLPGLPTPTADLTSRPNLVFDTPAKLQSLLGRTPTGLRTIATGYFGSPRFQTHDPNGDGPLGDLPLPPSFVDCAAADPCETTDERFTRDGSGNPIVIDTPQIPFTIAIPSGTPPPGGWPVIIQQHGLGGQRDLVVGFAEADAAAGFASIGIDAVAHGYRMFACTPAADCSQDTANNFGGTAVPDGFADGSFAGFSVSFLSVNLGFFQAFHNFVGVRDNFRQTYADLLSLGRLIQGHSIDGALGTTLDDGHVFYVGHSLGGLMGSGLVPIETHVQAALLNASGGGLTNQLFINSSIGASAAPLVTGILGLDPADVQDQFAFQPNLVQSILDPADGVNSAALLLDPDAGAPRNVIQVEDFGDEVVPNQANEALAIAAGLPIFDPYVQNLHESAETLALANPGTPGTVRANAAGGLATAALLQNGPATHAASVGSRPGTLTFVPEFAHLDDFALTGNAFPTLARPIRVPNAGIFDEVLGWFRDIVSNGPPGRFSFADPPDFNPIENLEAPAGASTVAFFTRSVDAGGGQPAAEQTADVTVAFSANAVATRVTAGRATLGATPLAVDGDVPPGPFSTVGAPGILPFFVTLQRQLPGMFSADLSIAYTPTELMRAGIVPGSSAEAALAVGTFVEDGDCGANGPCLGATYTMLPTTIDAMNHVATAQTSSFSTFAVLNPNILSGAPIVPLVPGGGPARSDCRAEWEVVNPTNMPALVDGLVSTTQTCMDGDLLCDGDAAADGACGFRVAICLNESDASLPDCTPSETASVHIPLGRTPANAGALLDALAALGGTRTGRRLDRVSFTPALSGGHCTAFVQLSVPKGGRQKLRLRATSGARTGDSDRLRLVCQ